jgi:hypothetical protein
MKELAEVSFLPPHISLDWYVHKAFKLCLAALHALASYLGLSDINLIHSWLGMAETDRHWISNVSRKPWRVPSAHLQALREAQYQVSHFPACGVGTGLRRQTFASIGA